jgi:hypothetical protein
MDSYVGVGPLARVYRRDTTDFSGRRRIITLGLGVVVSVS